uniref:Centrosomal protein 68 n=1 Tax=Sphaeramia orbicularis TaxID=375764 RepID=A0A672ZQB6_9TELE
MEAKGCDLRWTMHHSELKHKGRVSGPSIKDGETDQAGDGGGPHRSVTVAPTSRYMTDRHYVPRKPLCSLIQHTSILKKTHPPTRPELNPPLRPQLTSTVLHPTYSPRSGYCRPGQADLRLGGNKVRGGGGTNSKGNTLSPYQANYWTCAIPKDLPPSSQHHSRSWDPNREYQALLDYTYPLRPGTSTKPPGNISLQSDRNLQDSGIELDQLCSSTSLSELNFPLSGTGQTRERSGFCIDQKSAYIMGGRSSGTPLSLTEPGISLDSCDSGKDGGNKGNSAYLMVVCSSAFLPRTRCVGAEVDEEFRALPEQLKEMQLLSRQVLETLTDYQSINIVCTLYMFQIFCSHLEQLIHWLHIVSKKMDMLAPPTVDIDSVKSSLAQYQSFQREVSSCHPLTSSVVHTGQLLLSCLNTTSPSDSHN